MAERPVTLRGIHQAARETGGLVFAAPSLIYLALVIGFGFAYGPLGPMILATAILLVYGYLFLYACGIALYPLRLRIRWYAASWLIILVLIPMMGPMVAYLVVFQAMIHVLVLPWRPAVPTLIPIAAAAGVVGLVIGEIMLPILAVVGLLMALGVGSGIQRERLSRRLEAAEQRNAVLAVAAERERIGRDLHDILGHSLTTITVSAQLAQRLVEADPGAAREQLAQIEQISRQALADVRTTASGMRTVRAATEIAAARSVLEAAGIRADVPSALPTLDDARAELFGYAIREGVTNVVRHSRAGRASIVLGEDRVEVADDGTGIPPGATRTGLDGLRERVEQAGGRLQVDSTPSGTQLVVTLR
ncbi:sensor histidine kinase [Brachybacterium hainanense]|uniref:Sensor histidine kinase n=1 Tax=Brachybacterium hainanense TaxID=1541174 RepID=A0ABV6RED0_9MICO